MAPSAAQAAMPDGAEIERTILEFVAGCIEPVLIEPGEEPIALAADRFSLENRGDSCVLHAWSDAGSLVRRVTALGRQTRGKLELRARRFGQNEITVALVDAARKSESLQRQAGVAQFREFLRRILTRDYRDWRIDLLTASPDLEHSLSGLYARGILRQGQQSWAVLGVSAGAGAAVCDQILTFGLIWLEYLRRRETKGVLAGLRLFLPHGHTQTTTNRLAFLRQDTLRFRVHEFDEKGNTAEIDAHDFGNFATELPPCRQFPGAMEPVEAMMRKLMATPGVEAVTTCDGLISLRVRGLPIARAGSGVMTYGFDHQRPLTEATLPAAVRLAEELARFRSHDAVDRLNPLYRKYPESWLESQVRRDVRRVDSTLRREPVYTHPLSLAGADRGIIDLLACDDLGRLVVLELKATEDIHLPLQGLDYWMRVKWHLDRGEFLHKGYFPGIELSPLPPRLALVSPAVEFHPTTEAVLRYFPADVIVERVGVSEDWRRELSVVFRKLGHGRLA